MLTEKTGFRTRSAGLDITAAVLDGGGFCGRGVGVDIDEAGTAGEDFLEACGALPGAGKGGEGVDASYVYDGGEVVRDRGAGRVLTNGTNDSQRAWVRIFYRLRPARGWLEGPRLGETSSPSSIRAVSSSAAAEAERLVVLAVGERRPSYSSHVTGLLELGAMARRDCAYCATL